MHIDKVIFVQRKILMNWYFFNAGRRNIASILSYQV